MKLGIMQPYFFPYIGYWQLINAVDKYVIYDDVNYIKGGWINRNRILSNGSAIYFNLPIIGASSNKLINEVKVNVDEKMINKTLKTIKGCYEKAPFYKEIYPLLEKILTNNEENLALFLKFSLEVIAEYLDIQTEFILSSELDKNNNLKSQEKVIHICKLLDATDYYNAIGGQNLYSYDAFKENDINLFFLKTELIEYQQFKNQFISGLSIIDVLMFNSKDECLKQLSCFELIGASNE